MADLGFNSESVYRLASAAGKNIAKGAIAQSTGVNPAIMEGIFSTGEAIMNKEANPVVKGIASAAKTAVAIGAPPLALPAGYLIDKGVEDWGKAPNPEIFGNKSCSAFGSEYNIITPGCQG